MERKETGIALKRAVIKTVHDTFFLPVYGEAVPQGANLPCFSVVVRKSGQKRLLGRRRSAFQTLEIRYCTQNRAEGKEESLAVAEKLYEVLWLVGDEEKFLAEKLHHEEKEDGILFTAVYVWHMVLEENEEKMQRLELNGKKAVGYEIGSIHKRTAGSESGL